MTSSKPKNASTMAVVRGNRGAPHSNANAIRKRIVSTSALPTAPAPFQYTFSHVTQNSVARKRAPLTLMREFSIPAAYGGVADGHADKSARPEVAIAGDASGQPSQPLGELLDACAAAEPFPVVRRERRPVERARLPPGVQLREGGRQRRDVVRCCDD